MKIVREYYVECPKCGYRHAFKGVGVNGSANYEYRCECGSIWQVLLERERRLYELRRSRGRIRLI